jgi:hypothetical protein
MINLEEQVIESTDLLKSAWSAIKNPAPARLLPSDCFDFWLKQASLHVNLDETLILFKAREKALELVKSVALSSPLDHVTNLNVIDYNGIEMDFSIARHLAMTSYITTTWAIYDRLANVCGRLAGVMELTENYKQNPKLCEVFLNQKDKLGFLAHKHIQQSYSWPIRFSYGIRNWLVHEGYELGTVRLFQNNGIVNGFILHDDAIEHFQRHCNYEDDGNGKISNSCLSSGEECWFTKDLLQISEKYNNEIDTMFSGMLKWSVESFVLQIKSFTRMP